MSFCSNCGTKLEDGAKFCPNCGYSPDSQSGGQFQYAPEPYVDPKDITAEFSPEDIADNSKLAAITYLGVFIFLPFLAAPKSEFARFHANQSVALVMLYVICSLCMIVPFLGWLVGGVGYILATIFLIMGFVRAWKGKAKKLPIVGEWVFFKYKGFDA